jgi:hypothetical protein
MKKERKMNVKSKKEDLTHSGIQEQILEQIPTPVMAVNTDLEIIYMNAAGRTFLGLRTFWFKALPNTGVSHASGHRK